MKDFIAKKTQEIYEDFLANLRDADGLCRLKNLTYEGGNRPDYGDKFIQQYYMLRYFPAYLVEYFLMYKKLFRYNFLNSSLKVLSLGCGCGLDYWGLHFAAQNRGVSLDDMVYRGVDIVKWNYRHNFNHHDVKILKKDISTIPKFNRKDYNIIIFPKSIGEFPDDVFDTIEQILADSQFNHQRICVLCSVMKESHTQASDIARFRRIAKILKKHHSFKCYPHKFIKYQDRGINLLCSDFDYPNEIKAILDSLLNQCPKFILNGEACEHTCNSLNRSPMLRAKYFNYQIARFEKS